MIRPMVDQAGAENLLINYPGAFSTSHLDSC